MQDNRQYRDDNAELSIKDLFWSTLRRWRWLLAALLAGGVLLGGYAVVKDAVVRLDKNEMESRKQSYAAALEEYEHEKTRLETALKNLQEAQERQRYYQDNSLMLMMDQYNVSFINASFIVERDAEETPETYLQNASWAAAVLKRYQLALDQLDLDAVIADAEHPDLTACNPAGTQRKMLEASTDGTNTILSLAIYADNSERAEKIYAAAQETLAVQHGQLEETAGAHRLTVIAERRFSGVDAEIGKVQTEFQKGIKTVNDSITDTNKNLSALKAPSKTIPSVKSMIKRAVKYGAAGAVIGLFLAAFFFLVKFVFEDRLNSTEEIAQRYGLPVLGVQPEDEKKTAKLDRSIAKNLGVDLSRSPKDAAEYIAANVSIGLKDAKKLLLIGNCNEEKLNAVKDMLAPLLEGVEIAAAGNINESTEALNALRDSAAVICVEEWNKTTHKAIRRELQTVADSDSRNLGVIVTL